MKLREAIKQHFEVFQEIGDEALIRCPSPEHEDRKPSASVNTKKGLWTCYACGDGGKITDYLEGIRITENPETADLLAELSREVEMLDQASVHTLPESWLDQFDVPHDYWQERGFSKASIREFRLGYDWEWDAATYPIRDSSGGVLGVIRRRLRANQSMPDGRPMPKYVYPRNADVSECLFGYEKVRGGVPHLVITEGALDAIACWEAGFPAVGQYGIMLRKPQIELIKRINPISVILAYDQDAEGIHSALRTMNGETTNGKIVRPLDLGGTFVRWAVWDPALGKDPQELDPDVLSEALERAESTSLF